jgi:hypothetical protein
MKTDIKKLKKDFDLKDVLMKLRLNHYTRTDIVQYFVSLGYDINEWTIKNLLKEFDIRTGYYRKGQYNSFYGKKHTEETKAKISESRIGKYSGKNNPMFGKSGENSPAWKGGISTLQARFYSSDEWNKKRLYIMQKDNFKCVVCGKEAHKTKNTFNVHHIIPLSIVWDFKLEDFNLITLCEDCHKETFNKETYFIPTFQDIVRTTWRHVEVGRNDQSPEIQE